MTTVQIEERAGKYVVVLVSDTGCRTTVGRHTAKYKANAQRDRLNEELTS